MGFHVEINSILRSDLQETLQRGAELPFRKEGSRIFFDDLPIWLTSPDWTALAEIRVTRQIRTPAAVEGTFRVLHVYQGAEQAAMTIIFRRMFAGGADPFIYLTLKPHDFAAATAAGTWSPKEDLEHPDPAKRFIHASPADQLTRVANKHFGQFAEIYILAARADRVGPEIRWEPASDGNLYPHIFGPLNMDAVERSFQVRKGADDRFDVPDPRTAAIEAQFSCNVS